MTSETAPTGDEQFLVLPAPGSSRPVPEATIQVRQLGGWTVLESVGELGRSATRGLRALLLASPSTDIVVDLGRVTYVDHNVLAVMAHAHRVRRSLGGAVRLVAPPSTTVTLLEMAGAYELPPVYPTIEEAVR